MDDSSRVMLLDRGGDEDRKQKVLIRTLLMLQIRATHTTVSYRPPVHVITSKFRLPINTDNLLL